MKFIYTHTRANTLDDGRFLAYGSEVELSEEEVARPHNRQLVDSKALFAVEEPKAKSQSKKSSTKKRSDQ